MSKEFNSWQEVIIDFFNKKKEGEEEKYLKEKIKKLAEEFSNSTDEKIICIFKLKKPKDQASIGFQRDKALLLMKFKIDKKRIVNKESIDEYRKAINDINDKFEPYKWLSNNSKNANSVSFATHVVKLTHSKIDSPSFYDNISLTKSNQLTTSSLQNKTVDGAVAGNQFAPIFYFLELELKGTKLASELAKIDNAVLQPFAKNDNDLKKWNSDFNKSLATSQISAHLLLKQVYFPKNNKDYHLLCNVKSSSLAHTIFESLFKKDEKPAIKLSQENKYSNIITNSFYGKAKISVTGSNHSNASQLNGQRGGKINLFSTQPPTWQSKLKPPTSKKSMFDNYHYSPNTNDNIKYLVEFLLRNERIDLSIRDPEKQEWLEKWTASIIDDFWFFVGNIHNLPFGWSSEKGNKLKVEHKYLLDPYRKDKEFQANRKDSDWQAVVVSDFSIWLNKQLKSKDKKLTRQIEYSQTWKKVMKEELREYNQIIEVGIDMEANV